MYGRDDQLAEVTIGVEGNNLDKELFQVSPKEVILGESLLTPGLQTSVKVDSFIHSGGGYNFNNFKNKYMDISIRRGILGEYDIKDTLRVRQKIYRLDGRKLINNNNEQFNLKACDPSQLNDAETLISKSWKCASPSTIVDYALRSCAGVTNLDIQNSNPGRDYIAENIHPFQVASQQANYALDGDDPSFVHYMTYDEDSGEGRHHFRSLKYLCAQNPIMKYTYNETYTNYVDPNSIMTYSFPCDFDLLSDILNGVNQFGKDVNAVALINPLLKTFSLMGDNTYGCGLGSAVYKTAITNMNSAKQQDSCQDYASVYLLKRQARMNLLEKDKIALRVVVPFNPILHAGKTIDVNIYGKSPDERTQVIYGSGRYLILHMFHHVIVGGLATTVMDCVSSTVGQGEV